MIPVVVTISVVEATPAAHAVAGWKLSMLPALRVSAPKASVAEVPPLRLMTRAVFAVFRVVPLKVCEDTPVALPVIVNVVAPPPPSDTALLAEIRFVGVVIEVRSSVNPPPFTFNPPVKVLLTVFCSTCVVPPAFTSLMFPEPIRMLPT